MKPNISVAVIGAGPAGLTAAYLLAKRGAAVTVLERDPTYVGGIARTEEYKGFRFDIGGHRFFSKSAAVEALWTEILPEDMLVRPRSSRIFYRGRFFSYPLRSLEALRKLGPVEALRCLLSFFKARAFPIRQPRSFEDWVTNQFGARLFQIFFKSYTEKVWGMSCKEISADWAAQRIHGLSLMKAIGLALLRPLKRNNGTEVKSLIESFRYPRKGPGMLWEECARKVALNGGRILMGRRVTRCSRDPEGGQWRVISVDGENREQSLEVDHIIYSGPMRDLHHAIRPRLSDEAAAAARSLRYRDFLVVALIVKERNLFHDNWVYIHDPRVKVGRIQNFKSWSPEMVPDPDLCCYGLEYFCFTGDSLWSAPDPELIAMATRELQTIGLARAEDVLDGRVVRQSKAYPVYDDDYVKHVDCIRRELEERFPTFHLVGRNGMHRYNNQDHAMMTAMLTVENILSSKRLFDVWRVNQDAEYLEERSERESGASGLRAVPQKLPQPLTPPT